MRTRPISIVVVLAAVGILAAAGLYGRSSAASRPYVRGESLRDAGRYLVLVGGCNDCHTPGWDQSAGRLPESKWLTGNPVGFRGPWGTSYPSNLRLFFAHTSEAGWLHVARTRTAEPPMPWITLHALSTKDLEAVYAFVRSLGPTGAAAPADLPPGRDPVGPYILFEPQQAAPKR